MAGVVYDAGPVMERLHKILARAGLGSLRQIERWIAEGRVQVDGRTAVPGEQVSAAAKVMIDGRAVELDKRLPEQVRVLACYKPAGEICTRSDPQGRPTVFERLPRLRRGRWIGIGRLDYNTAGLLLFTNHGELANALMHPRSGIEREYAVRVRGPVSAETLRQLRKGVQLEDGPARFLKVSDAGGEGSNHWYHVTLAEGRNREVRRLWEAAGVTVSRLIRFRYGCIALPRERRIGECWELETAEVQRLFRLAGLAGEKPQLPSSRRRDRPAAKQRRKDRGAG
jgi:23S rRNA pseudouridine2605 synthase